MSVIISLLVAFFSTMGFALLFHLRPALLVPACLGGALAWGVYLLCGTLMEGVFFPCLIASAFAAAYAQILAWKTKAPLAVLYILAEVPLIPGSGLFNTMRSFVAQDWDAVASYAFLTGEFVFAIALSIAALAVLSGLAAAIRRQRR